jgi:hypothetical protein
MLQNPQTRDEFTVHWSKLNLSPADDEALTFGYSKLIHFKKWFEFWVIENISFFIIFSGKETHSRCSKGISASLSRFDLSFHYQCLGNLGEDHFDVWIRSKNISLNMFEGNKK